MCGIVGYVGHRKAIPLLIAGLSKLEYRGYDSAGVAVVKDGKFQVSRSVGKLSNLRSILEKNGQMTEGENLSSAVNVGIGHTRWATHGKPSETNAHPHVAGDVCVVHNGIIENYVSIREKLQKTGCTFVSETDTEIAARLINYHLQNSTSLLEAVTRATGELIGSYALVVISTKNPDEIVVAKNSTPVVIGILDGQMLVASDIPAVLEHTRRVVILEDGDIAHVRAEKLEIFQNNAAINREPITITWDPITAEKDGFRHFMLKEIFEQPKVVTDTFRGRIAQDDASVFLDEVKLTEEDFKKISRICIVACGTAWHAGLVTKFYLEKFAKIPVEVDYGSEFRYREPVFGPETLFIAISQSGETADTLGSLQLAKERGAKTLAICNVVGSTLSRRAENVLYTHAGPEISVASTKAFVTQLTAGYLLALRVGRARGALSKTELQHHLEQLVHLPTALHSALDCHEQVEVIAHKYSQSESFLFLGRGILYPIALEGALKLKEISYLHAEGYPAGEMKHGPIALIEEGTPVVAVLGEDGVNREKTISNLMEVRARGGHVIAITDTASAELKDLATEVVEIGAISTSFLPIVLTLPLQLLSYYVAVHRGTDVDQPRNLAKSVTVE